MLHVDQEIWINDLKF